MVRGAFLDFPSCLLVAMTPIGLRWPRSLAKLCTDCTAVHAPQLSGHPRWRPWRELLLPFLELAGLISAPTPPLMPAFLSLFLFLSLSLLCDYSMTAPASFPVQSSSLYGQYSSRREPFVYLLSLCHCSRRLHDRDHYLFIRKQTPL